MRSLAFDSLGTRVLQRVLDEASLEEAGELAAELEGCALRATKCPHANYFLQKLIETLPTCHLEGLFAELCGNAVKVARHKYGCRIACRIIEFHSADSCSAAAMFAEEASEGVSSLIRQEFGHHVVRALLQHGKPAYVASIADAICGDLVINASHRYGTYCVEAFLLWGQTPEVENVSADLIACGKLPHILSSPGGPHILRALIGQHVQDKLTIAKIVSESVNELRMTKPGRRVLAELGLEM